MEQETRRKALAWTILISILVTGLVVFVWVSNRGYLSVSISGQGNSEYSYKILDQYGATVDEKKSAEPYKKLLKRGSYQVVVTDNNKSFFEVAKTKGFFRTYHSEGSLAPEKSREFIGNSPDPCMYYLGGVLVSSGCGGVNFSEAKLHAPATKTAPTTTQAPDQNQSGRTFEGAVTLNGKSKILLGNNPALSSESSSDKPTHRLFSIGDDLSLDGGEWLRDLNPDLTYQTTPYKDGFLAYSLSPVDIHYYKSVAAEKITLKEPVDANSLEASQLDVDGDKIAVAYSNNEEIDTGESDIKQISPAPGKTILVVYENGNDQEYVFGVGAATTLLCGNSSVCILTGRTLQIYDISEGKPSLRFTVGDVSKIASSRGAVIANTKSGLIGINPETGKGSIQYSLDNYTTCGMQESGEGYILCVINQKQNRSALYIDPSKDDVDSIDKKVFTLTDNSAVTDVSPYKNILFVSPNVGDRVYRQATNDYGYDPERRKQAANEINTAVDRLGIDRTKYTIINTLP